MTDDSPYLASVLVVDDTVENLRLLASMLGDQGYEVRPVTNGRQALQAVEHDPPDLILLDINMPEMSGYEVCRRLKAREEARDIPVIFLTALTDTADKVKAFDVGGVDYVTKPFQFDEVLARVRTHVALRRARVALAESYERLRQLERFRDDLVHMGVHDMRSHLMVVLTCLSFVQRGAGHALSEQATADLKTAADATEDLRRMVNDLIDVSRLEEGKMPVNRVLCDVAGMAREVGMAAGAVDRQRRIDVDGTGPLDASCDPAILRRVFENLIGNAIKHTPKGSPLRILVTPRAAGVRVEVHDEGPGVPKDARDRIFEKFRTIETGQQTSYKSSGLGLSFCKLAVEAHGGAIGVDAAVPSGSIFWFELPV